MDAQDLRNLQEAYMEVCDEAYKKFPYKKVEDKIHKKEADNPTGRGTPQSVKMDTVFRHFKGGKEVRRVEKREHSPQISKEKEEENRARGNQKEQVDLYDIILSHLLDEGYAETQEAAEVIMVNMSEEWRENICEELTGERKKKALKKGFKHLATAREGSLTTKNRDSNLPLRRSGYGTRRGKRFAKYPMGSLPGVAKARMYPDKNRPDSDIGSGNKAARRSGKKVKDNEDRYYWNDKSSDF